jgi:hypothetical protein
MALTITKVLNTYSTSPQITPDDVAEIADLGYKSIIKKAVLSSLQVMRLSWLLKNWVYSTTISR